MKIINITKDNYEDVIKENPVILLDFWAAWCSPCRMLGPVLEEFSKESKIPVGKIDVDSEEDLANKFRVQSIPALFLLKDGKIVKQSLGYQAKEALLELVK